MGQKTGQYKASHKRKQMWARVTLDLLEATLSGCRGRRSRQEPSCTATLGDSPVVLLARWYTKLVLETSTVLLPVTAMALTTGAELFLQIRVATDVQPCRWTPQKHAKAACG